VGGMAVALFGVMRWTFGLIAVVGLGLVVGCGATKHNADESEGAAGKAGSGVPDSTEGPSAEELLEACSQLAESWCEKIEACSPALLASSYGISSDTGASSCVNTERDRCVDWFSNVPGVANSVEAVLAASPTTCAEAFEHSAPYRTGAQGEQVRGQACAWDEQCASGYCARAADSLCGKCDFVPPGVEPQPGQPCTNDACPQPLLCHEQICKRWPSEGEPCLEQGPTPGPFDFCGSGLQCVAGSCVTPLFFGDACNAAEDRCSTYSGLACQAGKCGLATPFHVEGPCGGYPPSGAKCGAGDTCVYPPDAFEDTPGQCQPTRSGFGAPCGATTDCPSGMACLPSENAGAAAGGNGNVAYIGFCGAPKASSNCE
jgi:hypothetical protein